MNHPEPSARPDPSDASNPAAGTPWASTTALSQAALGELGAVQGGPCLSLYQPTHRAHPDNLQDPIRFRQGMKLLHDSLQRHPGGASARALLAPLERLADDHGFWQHSLDGLAVLAAPGLFRVFVLQRAVKALAVVADSLHTKPLRRLLQTVDRYQVLGLSRQRAQLFEGHRDSLAEIPLVSGPVQAGALAPAEPGGAQASATVATSLGARSGPHGAGGAGDKPRRSDGDTERYFRAVDRAVIEHHSGPTGLPLILAALPEHHHLFRRLSHNPQLLAQGLLFDPHGMAMATLREQAWQALAPAQQAEREAWAERFGRARAQGLGSDELAQVAAAAAAGRVATLRIEAGRQIGGRLDRASGHIERADLGLPDVDDLLDDLAELVESLGGEVQVLHAEAMPTERGVAALFRH